MAAVLLLPVLFGTAGALLFALVVGRSASGAALVPRVGGAIMLVVTGLALWLYTVLLGWGAEAFQGPAWPSTAAAAWLATGCFVGSAAFGFEWLLGVAVARSRRRLGAGYAVVEGGTRGLLAADTRALPFLTIGLGLAVVEELLWRQVLIGWLSTEGGWSTHAAVLLTASLFGLNHYWFGVRSVVAKAVFAAALGWLLVAGGSVVYPIAAHAVFQVLVWRRLRNQQRRLGHRARGGFSHVH